MRSDIGWVSGIEKDGSLMNSKLDQSDVIDDVRPVVPVDELLKADDILRATALFARKNI